MHRQNTLSGGAAVADGNPAVASRSSPPLQSRDARTPSRTNTAINSKDEDSNNNYNDGRPSLVKSNTATSLSKAQSGAASPAVSQLHQKPTAATNSSNHESQSQTPIDPLSQYILKRTNTEKSGPQKARPQVKSEAEPSGSEPQRSFTQEDFTPGILRGETNLSQKSSKDKKKGVSFLSRIIGSKKKASPEWKDDVSETGEIRATGMDAEVFAQPIGYIPRFPPPPKYIKVRSRHKKGQDFDRLFIAQELWGTSGKSKPQDDNAPTSISTDSEDASTTGRAVWALEFSKDGKFLAAAGQDKKVRVWSVIASKEDRQAHEIEEEAQNDQPFIRLRAPVFKSQPVQEYEGHTGSVVDLSWSKNNFLLSTSMDKTVRLWHVTRNECLCCFNHSDFVTSIQFHPHDDRFFLAGSLDSKLRLWSIPDKSVAFIATVPDMITSVAFTPDGKYSIAGCLNGLCLIYDTDGLKAHSQIHVRSARGRNAKGSKITGIDTIFLPPKDSHGSIKLLITSNDSRIRLYNFRDRSLQAKFRGNENASSQIRATFSSDGRYVICGSEDRKVYIWPINSPEKDPEKRAVEIFDAHPSVVTCAIMAPIKTKQLLDNTGDLLYDLCNPPPVRLVSQPASATSKPTTDAGRSRVEPVPPNVKSPTFPPNQKKDESQAYTSRSTHPGGNIIIAADCNGSIKAFRQDCGYFKRRADTWDTGFSRKILGRNNSVSTRHSVASSFGRESSHKTPSERILSWRNAVMGTDNPSFDNLRSSISLRTRSPSPSKSSMKQQVEKPQCGHVPKVSISAAEPSRRSFSPVPSFRQSFINPFSGAASSEYSPQPSPVSDHNNHNRSQKPSSNLSPTRGHNGNYHPAAEKPRSPDPLWMEGNQSYMFWNKQNFAAQASNMLRPVDSRPSARHPSSASSLTSELSSEGGGGDEFDDDVNGEESEGEAEGEDLTCPRCQGVNFRATRTRSGEQKLICVKCGFPAPS
ncbi:hypothetical protein AJ79_06818 [Helicocarpus griseus UAMH5409]|uniref:Uncharacterized protein n=1 Tax=Helicocarpus griseus UAMH5409 TaxID=1447875 RepID=A0A2B7X8X3_9EURO|nr:hypothetical protein AJ79_06818 [Helicocarpus griseus UAMH5409]